MTRPCPSLLCGPLRPVQVVSLCLRSGNSPCFFTLSACTCSPPPRASHKQGQCSFLSHCGSRQRSGLPDIPSIHRSQTPHLFSLFRSCTVLTLLPIPQDVLRTIHIPTRHSRVRFHVALSGLQPLPTELKPSRQQSHVIDARYLREVGKVFIHLVVISSVDGSREKKGS